MDISLIALFIYIYFIGIIYEFQITLRQINYVRFNKYYTEEKRELEEIGINDKEIKLTIVLISLMWVFVELYIIIKKIGRNLKFRKQKKEYSW